jgi:hypothetical protein
MAADIVTEIAGYMEEYLNYKEKHKLDLYESAYF